MPEAHIWSLFFAAVVNFQHHPGCKNPKTIAECGAYADEMVLEFKKRFEVISWPDGLQLDR